MPKIHIKYIDGFQARAYRDPSTISGEWVVTLNERTERFNARKWTMGEAIKYMVDFERSKISERL